MDNDTALKLGNAFGGGIGRSGETCGTVTGALMIIGLKHGASETDDKDSKQKTYALAKEFIRRFKEMNDSVTCRDLVGFDIGLKEDLTPDDWAIISARCPKFIADAVAILEEIA
ncbi:MAG: C-GCAxxG-C-C family protein [Nitrospirota bacterium]